MHPPLPIVAMPWLPTPCTNGGSTVFERSLSRDPEVKKSAILIRVKLVLFFVAVNRQNVVGVPSNKLLTDFNVYFNKQIVTVKDYKNCRSF